MNTFHDAMRRKDFVLTATMPMSATTSAAEIAGTMAALKDMVDAVQVGDDRMAHGQPDSLAVAAIALQQGVDPVVHLSCRDRNRLALQAALLGLVTLGVSSVVLTRGQKLPDKLRGKVKGVFDTTTPQLIEMAGLLTSDNDESAGIYLGARASVIRPGKKWRAAEMQKRIDAGARFVQTQSCLNTDMLQAWAAALVRLRLTHTVSLHVDLPILSSAAMLRQLTEAFPASRIPARIVRAVTAGTDSRRYGQTVAAEALRAIAATPGMSGANLIYEGNVDIVADVIAEAGL